jgi:hypothetical protein
MTTFGDFGVIITTELGDGGSGYAEDDTFGVIEFGELVEGVVDTVDGGVVVTYHLTAINPFSKVRVGEPVFVGNTSGGGSDLQLVVTEIGDSGDGTVQLVIEYEILDTTLYP